jgi:hypothetical protein
MIGGRTATEVTEQPARSIGHEICGIGGVGWRILFPPCKQPATEDAWSRCPLGHVRRRKVCKAHLDVLTRPRPNEQAYCLVCHGHDRLSPLVPLIAAPVGPSAERHWEGES